MNKRILLIVSFGFLVSSAFSQVKDEVQPADLNLMHSFKKEGPISVQCIWSADSMPYTWFQAALHAGTKSYPGEAFLNACDDYRIEFELREFNGGYALGVTFAQSKYELALTLLEELLIQTDWSNDALTEWKRTERYHFQYYRNDPDSTIKWWMNRKEAHYLNLGLMKFDANSSVLYSHLGRPQLISVVGRINKSQIGDRLSKFIETVPSSFSPRRSFKAAPSEFREGMKNFYGLQVVKIHANPLLSHLLYVYSFHQFGGNNFASSVSNIDFESPRVSIVAAPIENTQGSFVVEVQETVHLSLTSNEVSHRLFDQLYEAALIYFYRWKEYNRNEALYQGLIEIGVWDVVDSLEKEAIYQILDHTVHFDMFIRSYAPKED